MIRVIDDEGKMIGIYQVADAVRMAYDKGLDLIEIAPDANPPTCKIMDYGKWKYENKKKQTAARKNQVVVQIKEIQLRPRTDKHDFETKMNHARRFLLEGDKVKVNMRFMGRELAHQEFGMDLMKKVIDVLSDLSLVESQPKLEGRQAFLMLGPDPVKVKEYLKAHPKPQLTELENDSEDDQDESDAD